jgi:hypothetical protein
VHDVLEHDRPKSPGQWGLMQRHSQIYGLHIPVPQLSGISGQSRLGKELGETLGNELGASLGAPLGILSNDGWFEGLSEGEPEGLRDGEVLGISLGLSDGEELGCKYFLRYDYEITNNIV